MDCMETLYCHRFNTDNYLDMGVDCMNLRKTCYSARDTKVICPECGKRGFLSKKPDGVATLHCHNCCRYIELDFTEEKEWYGGYDGKQEIFDCIYCNEYKEVDEWQGKLKEIFPEAVFADASDGIHGDRFSIEMKENIIEYRKALIKTGLCLNSLNFNLFIGQNPGEGKKLVEECIGEGFTLER